MPPKRRGNTYPAESTYTPVIRVMAEYNKGNETYTSPTPEKETPTVSNAPDDFDAPIPEKKSALEKSLPLIGIAAISAALIAGGLMLNSGEEEIEETVQTVSAPLPTTADPSPTAEPSPSATTSVEPARGSFQEQAPTTADPSPTLREFAQAWVNTAEGKEAWLAGLRPLVTDEIYSGFEYTSETNLPAFEYVSSEITSNETSRAMGTVTYKDQGTMLEVGLIAQNDGSWRVGFVSDR